MIEKHLSVDECEELMSKISLHSTTVWRLSAKLYHYAQKDLVPAHYKPAIIMLLKIVDTYIATLEDVKFLEKKTIN